MPTTLTYTVGLTILLLRWTSQTYLEQKNINQLWVTVLFFLKRIEQKLIKKKQFNINRFEFYAAFVKKTIHMDSGKTVSS